MRKTIAIISLILTIGLTGCGMGNTSYDYDTTADSMGFNGSNRAVTNSILGIQKGAGGNYSNTNINSSSADYSYDFSASGKTTKTKDEMLADYEEVQSKVKEFGGFIENVYNDWQNFDMEEVYSSSNGERFKSIGKLSFTIEVKNDKVEDVLSILDKMCTDNGLTVTHYSQQIHNYENYEIVDEYDDNYYYDEVITQDELDKRLEYADIAVDLIYQNPRSLVAVMYLKTRNWFRNIISGFDDILNIIVVITILMIVVFFEVLIFYRAFKKKLINHRKKHPELYLPKEIIVKHED